MQAILDQRAAVADLVDHGWIHLFAMEVATGKTWKYLDHANWTEFTGQA